MRAACRPVLLAVGDRSAESTCVLIRFDYVRVGRWRSFSSARMSALFVWVSAIGDS